MKRIEYYTLLGWEAEVIFKARREGNGDHESEYEIYSFFCGQKVVRRSTDRALYSELHEHFEEHDDFSCWAENVEQGMIEELEEGASDSDD